VRAATARCFASKLGIQSDRVLNAVMNDRMIAKGLVLHWATAFFVDFLATEPMDDLVAILRKARPAPRPPPPPNSLTVRQAYSIALHCPLPTSSSYLRMPSKHKQKGGNNPRLDTCRVWERSGGPACPVRILPRLFRAASGPVCAPSWRCACSRRMRAGAAGASVEAPRPSRACATPGRVCMPVHSQGAAPGRLLRGGCAACKAGRAGAG
jgi:hypothetical protein